MFCTGYIPVFQDQINGFDPLGSASCTCYAGAMAGDYDTCGNKKPTGERVRQLTGDKVGGTTLLQVDGALNTGWDINLDTRIGSSKLTWEQFTAKINAGHGAILQGSYVAIHGTRFAGDLKFQGNHAVYIHPGWIVEDPLCDGRRPGIYKYHGEAYPQTMLKEFAGLLVLDEKKNKRLGIGYVWCSLTRDNQERFVVTLPNTGFFRYFMTKSIITSRSSANTKHRGGTFAVGLPRTYPVKTSSKLYKTIKYKRLVRILEGPFKGWMVSAAYAKEL